MIARTGDASLKERGLVIGLVYNCKHDGVGDAEAEYDSMDTVNAIAEALRAGGCEVKLFAADGGLASHLMAEPIDIAFNIAEGIRGRGREAEAPAIFNMLNIPFVGSDETALCVSLDKNMCKRLMESYGVVSPRGMVVAALGDLEKLDLRFPVIVKPNAEGSSKGIPDACVAPNREVLKSMVAEGLTHYNESFLVEEYVAGREFTVGILGNGPSARVFPPMEIAFRHNTYDQYRIYSYGVKQDYQRHIEYICPAAIDPQTDTAMRQAALTVFNALGCHDFTRVDFRLSESGTPYFIEINPLPGLAPNYSDFPMLAQFNGLQYGDLVRGVLHAALKRLGMAEEGK